MSKKGILTLFWSAVVSSYLLVLSMFPLAWWAPQPLRDYAMILTRYCTPIVLEVGLLIFSAIVAIAHAMLQRKLDGEEFVTIELDESQYRELGARKSGLQD